MSRHSSDRIVAAPREVAAALERAPRLPAGAEEHHAGYGVLGQRFTAGDALVLWRCPASSQGPPHTAVWHRGAAGGWTLFADVAPHLAWTRRFATGDPPAVRDTIVVTWTGSRRLVVTVRDTGLVWSVELAPTTSTRMVQALTRALPDRWWRSDRALRLTAGFVGPALGVGRVRLCGRAATGAWVRLRPLAVWRVSRMRAALRGRDFGAIDHGSDPAGDGGVVMPSRGVFAAGVTSFVPDGR